MHDLDIHQVRREAYNTYLDLTRLHSATQASLESAYVTQDDVACFHQLATRYLAPLGISLEALESDDPRVLLKAGLESLSSTMGKLRKLMHDKPPKEQGPAKTLSKLLVEMDTTFLHSEWLDNQTLADKAVAVGKSAALLYREDRPPSNIPSAVHEEITHYKKFAQELVGLIGPYNKACHELFGKLEKVKDGEEGIQVFQAGIKHLPPTPASGFKHKQYPFLGVQKSDRLVIKSRDRVEFGYQMKPTRVNAGEDLPPLKPADVKRLAEAIVDLAELYTHIDAALDQLMYRRDWEAIGDGIGELEIKNHQAWEQIHRTLSPQGVAHVSDAGLVFLRDHCHQLAVGIHHYLKAVTTK